MKRRAAYSRARNEMLARTHNETTPWFVRLEVIRHILSRVGCPEKDEHAASPDARSLTDGRLAA